MESSYLSGLEYTLDFCVALLKPFSFSKDSFLSNDFSVWKKKTWRGELNFIIVAYFSRLT